MRRSREVVKQRARDNGSQCLFVAFIYSLFQPKTYPNRVDQDLRRLDLIRSLSSVVFSFCLILFALPVVS